MVYSSIKNKFFPVTKGLVSIDILSLNDKPLKSTIIGTSIVSNNSEWYLSIGLVLLNIFLNLLKLTLPIASEKLMFSL